MRRLPAADLRRPGHGLHRLESSDQLPGTTSLPGQSVCSDRRHGRNRRHGRDRRQRRSVDRRHDRLRARHDEHSVGNELSELSGTVHVGHVDGLGIVEPGELPVPLRDRALRLLLAGRAQRDDGAGAGRRAVPGERRVDDLLRKPDVHARDRLQPDGQAKDQRPHHRKRPVRRLQQRPPRLLGGAGRDERSLGARSRVHARACNA